MDKAGIRDNLAEFSMSQELQPFVIKVYECNGLIIVTEYVTVISKEEFNNSKDEIRHILSYLSEGYLLGDVGTITKNFMNWGFRDDNSLVILDFAYIYRVLGEEMICGGLNSDGTTCENILEYDENFNNLVCPICHKKYTFHDIRRKISKEYETKELETIKQIAIKISRPVQEVDKIAKVVNTENSIKNNNGGTKEMGKFKDFDIDAQNNDINIEDAYLNAISFMKNSYNKTEDNSDEKEDLNIDIISDEYQKVSPSTIYGETNSDENNEDIQDIIDELNGDESDESDDIYDFTDESYDSEESEEKGQLYGSGYLSEPLDDDDEYETDDSDEFDKDIQDVIDELNEEKSDEDDECLTENEDDDTYSSDNEGVIVLDNESLTTPEETSEENKPVDSGIMYITSKEDEEALRKELMESVECEEESDDGDFEDEYEAELDKIAEENTSRKYSSKKKNWE